MRAHITKTIVLLTFLTLGLAPAADAALRAPKAQSPANDATVQAIPAFTWAKVKGADHYEFQLSADDAFGSIVSKGSFTTRNTAATIDSSLADGTYYWRLRAVSAKGKAGKWSRVRSVRKSWKDTPALVGPVDDAKVVFPSSPLVLKWSSVRRAYKYNVYIATDPQLASLVLSSKPISTSGTVYAPGAALAPGRYYWAVEPVDATGRVGSRSAVGSFVWTWPTATATSYEDLIADPRVADPQFKWDAVPGAVAYELEVNFSVDFAPGSKLALPSRVVGTSFSSPSILPNNVYYWRVRAIDAGGNAGQWNVGLPIDKNFGNVPPTVEQLALRDNAQAPAADLDAGTAVTDTIAPVVTWAPVPAAASYDVQRSPWVTFPNAQQGCDWSQAKTTHTLSTAWTPIGSELGDGVEYCIRVRAVSGNEKVYSDWTQLFGLGNPAFVYHLPSHSGAAPLRMFPGDYLGPATGSTTPRLPVLRWKPVNSAASYVVVISKDQAFTNITDTAVVRSPAYVPRKGFADETTPYYWAVLPAAGTNGTGYNTEPVENGPCDGGSSLPCNFLKRSTPPALVSPAPGADVTAQPVFRWQSGETDASLPAGSRATPEGAQRYRLQISQDPTFANPIDDVKTSSLAWTSDTSYPADTVLYWRVRVDDEDGNGLTWSPTGTFQRRIPTPSLVSDNPLGGSLIPALRWNAVEGASSYDFHVEQANGTKKDFNIQGTVLTPTTFYGTGIWRWQVRAAFPSGVKSAYTAPIGFTRDIPKPDGIHADVKSGRVLLGWEPGPNAKAYRVQFSSTNSFGSGTLTATTQNLTYAPTQLQGLFVDGGKIFWRVATIDEGGNVGAYATGTLTKAKRMSASASGGLRKGVRSQVSILVRDARGNAVRKAKVKVTGAARARARRTGKKGVAVFNLKPRRRGTVSFRITKAGYQPLVVTASVR